MAIAQSRHAEEAGPNPLRVHTILWNSLGHGSIAYAITELLDNMPVGLVERKLWSLGPHPSSPRDYHAPARPQILFRAFNKARVSAPVQGAIAREAALRAIRAGDIVYMWPPFDLPLIKRAQARGAIVVAERTNCMGPMAREALSRAFARRGMRLPTGWFPPEVMAEERNQMLQCDYVVARNSFVSQSLRDAGLREERIIEGSYGFSPARLASAIGIQKPDRPPVFAFVGYGIIGKGLDVLLEAWEKAGVDGTLLIAGEIDDELRSSYSRVLARPDVRALGFVADVASVYATSDVFVFPSHVEGGPQVTYEAAACGLPSMVSPMGAGRIVRDGSEGLIIDPLDVDQLAAAITRLAADQDLRRSLGQAAANRARDFTWEKIAKRLYDQFSALAPSVDV